MAKSMKQAPVELGTLTGGTIVGRFLPAPHKQIFLQFIEDLLEKCYRRTRLSKKTEIKDVILEWKSDSEIIIREFTLREEEDVKKMPAKEVFVENKIRFKHSRASPDQLYIFLSPAHALTCILNTHTHTQNYIAVYSMHHIC